ncbi:MAG TPA: universal stress protein [Vicinamibacterales bacterium]|jgi:nucleotide-binding universal stress UspA family protein|nr:universal stress protein [Vicinamibacterales bacterium]
MIAIKHILCPVDFSEYSRHALEQAVALARHHHATVMALHVFAVAPVAEVVPIGAPTALEPVTLPLSARGALENELRKFVSPVQTEGVTIGLKIGEGDPLTAIVEAAEALEADLIVMGTHGRSGFQRLLLGSVAENLLRKTACPVLTVPPRADETTSLAFGRMLCAIDFSPASLHALEYAAGFASGVQTELYALNVVELMTEGGTALRDELVPGTPDFRAEFRRAAAERLTSAIPASVRACARVRELVTVGKPDRQILHVAEEEACDLIVMGVQARTAADRMLFGSVAQHVLREARCPVLTVRA